jgi:hypothetical protein
MVSTFTFFMSIVLVHNITWPLQSQSHNYKTSFNWWSRIPKKVIFELVVISQNFNIENNFYNELQEIFVN